MKEKKTTSTCKSKKKCKQPITKQRSSVIVCFFTPLYKVIIWSSLGPATFTFPNSSQLSMRESWMDSHRLKLGSRTQDFFVRGAEHKIFVLAIMCTAFRI